ncbi:hypothetical protein vB_AbaM_Acibel004_149 [Acinetobacter phage vB_AbaM_Acibel004]|uniref:tail fiber protein n=1 Tax=Acinetobacter phage vB_AbaM_Acibel004 TaxID=1481186 RepID=UPI0004E856BE|nr:tail fiber protein [Acinetobacter phage vB_AbaM_Acibel004]AHY26764.1 hypothetical protein vB_AbaM_Acibel004_149 [Acinetobacter phage vB_AbaM_Acibel004]
MALTGNEVVLVIGNQAQTFATLNELKEFLGGEGGVTEDQLKTKADKTYVDNKLKLKFDIPTNEAPKDGASLIFANGKWEISNPVPI